MTNRYQPFYQHWRNNGSGGSYFSLSIIKLSLGGAVNSRGKSSLPSRWEKESASGNRILATKSYDDFFRRLRQRDCGLARGAVITGQPGVGTFFYDFEIHTPLCVCGNCSSMRPFSHSGKATFLLATAAISSSRRMFDSSINDVHLFYHS